MKTELLNALFEDQVLLMHEPDIYAMVAAMQSGVDISTEPTNKDALEQKPRYTQIDVSGPIIMRDSVMGRMFGGCATEILMEQIKAADDIGAPTLFRFATGGGQPGFIGEAADMIRNMSVPTIGYAAEQCCSAGFWLYSQCQNKYAHDSAILGSIGVKLTSMSQEDPSKVIVSQFAPNKLPSEKKLQRIVNDYESCFIGAVAKGYQIDATSVVKQFGAGDVFMGEKARNAGMCTELTTLDQITRNMKTESEIRSEAVMDYLDSQAGFSAMEEDAPPNKKGVAGDNTGGEARRLIRSLRNDDGDKRGWTIAEIATAIQRSESVTSAIANGEIENPPQQVIDRLKRMQSRTKPEKSMAAEETDREALKAELLEEIKQEEKDKKEKAKARSNAISASEHSKCRPKLTKKLIEKESMSVEDAIFALENSAVEVSGGQSFSDAAAEQTPGVDAGGKETGEFEVGEEVKAQKETVNFMIEELVAQGWERQEAEQYINSEMTEINAAQAH